MKNKIFENNNRKQILTAVGFDTEVARIELGLCPTCEKPIYEKDFKDALSRKEYQISGMCQCCQDSVFGE